MGIYTHELCQPCGSCGYCQQRRWWRRRSADLGKALKLIRELSFAIEQELYAAGNDEVQVNSTLRQRRRLTNRADAFVARVKLGRKTR